ncbi:MAG: hypothetical protein PQJ59_13975 [Spirochaetales bacterium]|nr:hypothetical protein [Spirochaetales bacterium]
MPYVAEIGNYARVFAAREDWITSLLDSSAALESETHTLNVAYEGYWDRNSSNVIDLQNAAAKGGVLDRDTALNVLVKYINDTYSYAKPSELYLGEGAQYDVDEMIALWRVVELSPNTLSKVSTGSVVPGTEISPFFVRKAKYREDALRLLNYFDGQRVHASDSYKARLYDDGKEMHYSYADPEFLEKVNYLQQWYAEGLIHSEFADLSVKDEFRKSMYFADSIEGQKQFGFMTYDWIASTTAGSDKIVAVLPPVTTITDAGIKKFVHYMENTRVIKPDGWAISAAASQEEINAALTLFNYMFTEEGNDVQNYSIPAGRLEGEVFTAPDGTEYPKFSPWMFEAAGQYKNGDVSGFLRDFMGSHLALGYQKEIGFEMQYTKNNGPAAWALYTKAGVLTPSYGSKDAALRLMPPLISLTEQNLAKLATVSVGDGQTESIFMYVTGLDSGITDATDLIADFDEAGLDVYLDVYKTAYDRMMAK